MEMEAVLNGWNVVCKAGQRFGPYLLVELILPGGTLIALLMYLFRQKANAKL
jgi:hypothetical protein